MSQSISERYKKAQGFEKLLVAFLLPPHQIVNHDVTPIWNWSRIPTQPATNIGTKGQQGDDNCGSSTFLIFRASRHGKDVHKASDTLSSSVQWSAILGYFFLTLQCVTSGNPSSFYLGQFVPETAPSHMPLGDIFSREGGLFVVDLEDESLKMLTPSRKWIQSSYIALILWYWLIRVLIVKISNRRRRRRKTRRKTRGL